MGRTSQVTPTERGKGGINLPELTFKHHGARVHLHLLQAGAVLSA
jgi:hypothetical protein